jgi:hypothetical protein
MTRKLINTGILKVVNGASTRKKLVPKKPGAVDTTKVSKVKSSNLYLIEYDSKTKILTLTFNNRRKYVYFGVSSQRHKALTEAPSKGEYFTKFIRYVYKYKEI